jgi:cytochrome o ubiquinol oxidase subunit 1
MIFFVAIPLVSGVINFVMPLQIGARDVAFPVPQQLELLADRGRRRPGHGVAVRRRVLDRRLAQLRARRANLENSPGVGPDYYLWALQIAGVGTTLSALNMVDHRHQDARARHDHDEDAGLHLDRLLQPGAGHRHLPDPDRRLRAADARPLRRDQLLHQRPWWQPDDVLEPGVDLGPPGGLRPDPAGVRHLFGSDLDLHRQALFGYSSMVYATVVITILSYLVWLHHFFTMGSGASVNSFFGIATMVIAIPTGAKIFNWLFTMYRGEIRFELPMMWVVAFMLTFVVGGMTGVLLAVPPADFVLHNSLFLVAHFHNVIIGGVVFGLFAGIEYWFPKAFGFKLDKFWGKVHFWGWVIGYWVAWTPIYIVGLMGTTRRVHHFDDPTLQPWFVIAAIGAGIILIGIIGFVIGMVVSYRKREKLRVGNDPWEGRTLEWSTTSPPPAYNFAFTPVVHDLDAWYDMKSRGYAARGGLPADPHAAQHGHGDHPVGPRRGARLRHGLVHVVAGGARLRGRWSR